MTLIWPPASPAHLDMHDITAPLSQRYARLHSGAMDELARAVHGQRDGLGPVTPTSELVRLLPVHSPVRLFRQARQS
jgi:hypothetical protein